MVTVPLVMYTEGARKIIGQATIYGDVVLGVLDPNHAEDVERHFKINGGEFSIPFPKTDGIFCGDDKKEN